MPMQSQHFSSPQIQSQSLFRNGRNALAVVYTDILHLCGSKFTQKVVQSIQAYNKVHMYSTMVLHVYSR